MARHKTNSKLKGLAVTWCVIIAIATIQAVLFFGVPSDFMGSPLDLRFMLVFAAMGVLGVILLVIAAFGHIAAGWSIAPFVLPGWLALYWSQALLTEGNFNPVTVAMFGLPIIAYTGGFVVSIYTTVVQTKLQRMSRGKHAAV